MKKQKKNCITHNPLMFHTLYYQVNKNKITENTENNGLNLNSENGLLVT